MSSEKSAVESEHQRLTRQLCRSKWEQGFAEGSNSRLRKAIEGALWLLKTMPGAGHSPEATIWAIERRLTESLELDDKIRTQELLTKDEPKLNGG